MYRSQADIPVRCVRGLVGYFEDLEASLGTKPESTGCGGAIGFVVPVRQAFLFDATFRQARDNGPGD